MPIFYADYEEKRFKREFRLSLNTNFDGLKTAMSNEGILTITAPKKDATQATAAKPSEPYVKLNLLDDGDTDKDLESLEGEAKDTTKINGKEEEEPPLSPSIKDRVLSISKKGNFFQDEYFENVWNDFEKAMDEMVQKEEKRKLEDRDERISRKKELASKLKSDMLLDAEKKQKEFFDRARKRESFAELGVPQYSRLNSYRNLRSWAPENETQACTITKDENGYKIIMDVKSYGNGDGDVSVKASEGYVTVTGKKGPLTFKKEFTISGLTKPDQVNASVSEDGVLTITAAV
ncbi:hypothetical protein Anas_09087 [Armadillidium nasatum]|uniref:SHSP domain-containing protein n=1 Tax=Armadillidium nasatum TaxID=96803 RepID=A0A5N5TFE2_9CRUS|nr:hypothetical protein Anas_09087 [Armadillidium nasatum]